MKFESTIVAAIFVGLSSANPISADVDNQLAVQNVNSFSCKYGGSSNIDKSAMQICLRSYRTDNWDGKDCGGRGWFKGHSNWNSAYACYDACATCVSEGINQGANSVECEKVVALARCWMGYHYV